MYLLEGMAGQMMLHSGVFLAVASLLVGSTAASQGVQAAPCRYLPGDQGWPSVEQWSQLNASVSGRLIATVPGGHVCHDPTYDAAACAALQQAWPFPQTQYGTPKFYPGCTDMPGS